MNAQETIDLIKEHLDTGKAIQYAWRDGTWHGLRMEGEFPSHLPRECFRIAPAEPAKEFKMPEGGFWVRFKRTPWIHYWVAIIGAGTIWIPSPSGSGYMNLSEDGLRGKYEYSHTRREDDWHSF